MTGGERANRSVWSTSRDNHPQQIECSKQKQGLSASDTDGRCQKMAARRRACPSLSIMARHGERPVRPPRKASILLCKA